MQEEKQKNFQGTHGFEPWTYRTAADCSTTELYPQTLIVVYILCEERSLCEGSAVCCVVCVWAQAGWGGDKKYFCVLGQGVKYFQLYHVSVGGIMVSIAAFQAVDPGSIPGRRMFLLGEYWK